MRKCLQSPRPGIVAESADPEAVLLSFPSSKRARSAGEPLDRAVGCPSLWLKAPPP